MMIGQRVKMPVRPAEPEMLDPPVASPPELVKGFLPLALPGVPEKDELEDSTTCSSTSSRTASEWSSTESEGSALSWKRELRREARRQRQLQLEMFLKHYNFTAVDKPQTKKHNLSSFFFPEEEIYPVHVAARLGSCELMRELMAKGASTEQKTSKGRTVVGY
ncbi:unnamed protein product [Effrenium voratum]|nr:unnamed protein product [Effrenium voratum]